MVISTSFPQANKPVFCDKCHKLDKYLNTWEVAQLWHEGWEGDWMCMDCWCDMPSTWHEALTVTPDQTIGFLEITQEEQSLPIPNTDGASLRVTEYRIVEVSYGTE